MFEFGQRQAILQGLQEHWSQIEKPQSGQVSTFSSPSISTWRAEGADEIDREFRRRAREDARARRAGGARRAAHSPPTLSSARAHRRRI